MRKRSMVSIAGAIGVTGVIGYLLKKNADKSKAFQKSVEKAGIPDQLKAGNHEELSENADMVSEGSQYGVSYYNKVQEEKNKNK